MGRIAGRFQPDLVYGFSRIAGRFGRIRCTDSTGLHNPVRHRHLIAIGLLGKLAGPTGFIWAAATGTLPLSFGFVILLNDVIWWPALSVCLWEAAGGLDGLRQLFAGH